MCGVRIGSRKAGGGLLSKMFRTDVLHHVGTAGEGAVTPPSTTTEALSATGLRRGRLRGGLRVAPMRTDTRTRKSELTRALEAFDFLTAGIMGDKR